MGSQDVEFRTLEDCIEVIESYKNVEEIKAVADFEKYLNIIGVHHAKNGLIEEHLELLIRFVSLKKLKKKTIDLLTQCLIPRHTIPKQLVSEVVMYVLSFHHEIQSYITVSLLKWLIGLLEYELVDVSAVDDFYRVFYFMLENESFEVKKYVIRILCMLTQPEDVTEDKVLFLTQLEFKYGKNKYTQALFSLFKCYQPERVPASVPIMETFDVPKYLPSEEMEEHLKDAQKRNFESSVNSNDTVFKSRIPFIKLFTVEYMKPKYCKNIINIPDYEDNSGKETKKVTDIKSIAELENCWDNVQLPSNVLSLLGSEVGLHLLTFSDETLQLRFAFKLYDTCNKVFIRRTMNASRVEKAILLERVFELEEYMKQGIFVVSRFLANYLKCWNTYDHCEHVLNLIKWITFSSFEELKEKIILPLYDVFLISDVSLKGSIISTLSELLIHMFEADVYRSECNYRPLFLKAVPGWISADAGRTIGPVIRTIEHFITVGCLLEPKSLLFLHESINFYETLLELESRSNFAVMTIVSFNIVYKSLFSASTTTLTRVCRLLFRYPQIINSMEVESSVKNFEKEFNLMNRYCADIMNCLWFQKAVSNREGGCVFKSMDETVLRKLTQLVNIDGSFSLLTHMMFLPFLMSVVSSDHSLKLPNLLTSENVLSIIETYVPDIANLIKSLLE